MDIVIHGTKGGRKIFTPNKLSGLLDVNSDSPKSTTIGQKAYAIRLTENKLIFSQYKIIRDVRGDKRTGFVAFSLFLHKSEKLNGSDVVTLLDLISDEYCQRYIIDNNLSEVTENWNFLDVISSKYETFPLLNDENFQSGVKDDAFIYFNGLEELKSFFDAPYQEEYQPYRQILFVDNKLEGKPENPLNALRNSGVDLTGKIDLENPKYKLLFNAIANDGVKITVKVNGGIISSGNKFRRKNELEITWAKQYYKTIVKQEKCHKIDDGFISVNLDAKTVTIKEIELEPEEKTITFEIKDCNGNSIIDAEILIDNKFESKFKPEEWKKTGSVTFGIPFKGEKIGKSWTVTAKKGNNLISDPHRIDFGKDCIGNVELILKEKRSLEIIVHEETLDGNIIDNEKVSVNKTEFIADEIGETHKITVSCNGFESITFDFSPSNDITPIHKSLNKKKMGGINKTYKIDSGKYGKKSNNCPEYSNNKGGRDIANNFIIPNKGWKFKGWELNNNDTLIAQYIKSVPFYKKTAIITTFVMLVLVLGFSIVYLLHDSVVTDHAELNRKTVEDYLYGSEFKSKQLYDYKNNWESQLRELYLIKQDSIEHEKSKWYKPLTWFNDNEQSSKSDEQYQNDTTLQKIEIAIALRDSINDLNFIYVKNQKYSKAQNKFKESIIEAKSEDYELVRCRLKHISEYSLDEIADSIKAIVDSKQTKKDPGTPQENEVKNEIDKKQNAPKPIEKKQIKAQNVKEEIKSSKAGIDEDITIYLKGSELKKDKLNNYLIQLTNKDLKNSIKLCLKLWELDGTSGKSYSSLYSKVKVDNNFNNSALKAFLAEMVYKHNPIYLPQITGNATIKTLSKLRDNTK